MSAPELSADCQKWIDYQEQQFMRPSIAYLSEQDAIEYTGDDEAEPGYYGRLSAPGYLDCTDWTGPFNSPEEALEGLYDLYGDDLPDDEND